MTMKKFTSYALLAIFILAILTIVLNKTGGIQSKYTHRDLSNYDWHGCLRSASRQGLSDLVPNTKKEWTIFMNKCANDILSK